DGKKKLEDHIERLKTVVFQKQLGSMYDKSERVAALAEFIATAIDGDVAKAKRAGQLSRCDLMTEMVYEFGDMQGIMGRYQAQRDGEDAEITQAMDEFYMPRFSGDQLPQTKTGIAIALAERIDTLVGIFGIGIALWKLYTLYMMGLAVKKQAKAADKPSNDNPLGRVLQVGKDNLSKDIETLELKLAEAIMAERPAIERGINVVKIISVVAPLAGLLGTVTGMIVTFQQITLFGTGDPKIMAGGISQALVTTVLGLVVAIPTTLLHSFAASSSRGIINVLEEQSTGIVAEKSNKS
ncbi:MAG: glycine--tRNA ligase subunit beta, partial [Pelagibacteraceae bacterium]